MAERYDLMAPRLRSTPCVLVLAAIASLGCSRYIGGSTVSGIARERRAMRAEVQKIVEEIKQSVGLLRRHL